MFNGNQAVFRDYVLSSEDGPVTDLDLPVGEQSNTRTTNLPLSGRAGNIDSRSRTGVRRQLPTLLFDDDKFEKQDKYING